jgi:nucleoside 2-deoxyribosyltransferase
MYIAGPNMTGKEKQLVEKARSYFEAQGFEVTAIADEFDWMSEDGVSKAQYLQTAAEMIAEADMVCFLDNWRRSCAAQMERSICVFLDKPVRIFV